MVVNAEPRCKELGVVEGVGGNPDSAKADALERAAEARSGHQSHADPGEPASSGPGGLSQRGP